MVTVLSMCALMELDLTQESRQLALRDLGGLKVLVNILDTKEVRCIVSNDCQNWAWMSRRHEQTRACVYVCQPLFELQKQ